MYLPGIFPSAFSHCFVPCSSFLLILKYFIIMNDLFLFSAIPIYFFIYFFFPSLPKTLSFSFDVLLFRSLLSLEPFPSLVSYLSSLRPSSASLTRLTPFPLVWSWWRRAGKFLCGGGRYAARLLALYFYLWSFGGIPWHRWCKEPRILPRRGSKGLLSLEVPPLYLTLYLGWCGMNSVVMEM